MRSEAIIEQVPLSEADAILAKFRERGLTERQVLAGIGYTSSAISSARSRGQIRKSFVYAMRGLLATLPTEQGAVDARLPAGLVLTEEEALDLLQVLRRAHASGDPATAALIPRVKREIARLLVESELF